MQQVQVEFNEQNQVILAKFIRDFKINGYETTRKDIDFFIKSEKDQLVDKYETDKAEIERTTAEEFVKLDQILSILELCNSSNHYTLTSDPDNFCLNAARTAAITQFNELAKQRLDTAYFDFIFNKSKQTVYHGMLIKYFDAYVENFRFRGFIEPSGVIIENH